MNIDTAKKAVDYFFTSVVEIDKSEALIEQVTISFYGGEPLLAFPLIKEIILYTTGKYKGFAYDFRMTTNGYLLKDSILDFLAEYNCGISVSLDGPEEDHDRNRVLAGGGGTFKTVYANILK